MRTPRELTQWVYSSHLYDILDPDKEHARARTHTLTTLTYLYCQDDLTPEMIKYYSDCIVQAKLMKE